MTVPGKTWRHAPVWYGLLAACIIAYASLTILGRSAAAIDPYHLNQLQWWLIQLTTMIPIIGTWVIALWAIVTLKRYVIIIDDSVEAKGLTYMVRGFLMLLIYLVLTALAGQILNLLQGMSWINTAITIRNHLPAALSLIGFGLLYAGSHQLLKTTPAKQWGPSSWLLLVVVAIIGAVYVWGTLQGPEPRSGSIPSYTLPREVLVFTMVLPYCWAWFLGLFAALNLGRYARRARGVLYRQALRFVAGGVALIALFGVIIQSVTLASRIIIELPLSQILMLLYLLLLLYAGGFALVRWGVRKLTRIEVVQ